METRKDEQIIRVENASELELVNRTDFCYTAETINCNVIIPEEFCFAYKPEQ